MCGSHSPHANGNERLAGAALQLRYSRGAVAVEERRIGTVAAAYPRARRNAAAVYPRASCKSVVPRGFSVPRSLRCLQRSSWIQSVRQQRACTAHAPQMHRAYAADAPCQGRYLLDCFVARRLVGSVFTANPLGQGLASALFGRLGWTRNDVRIRGPRLSLRVDGRDDDAKAVSGVEVAAEDPRMVCGAHQGTERKLRQAFRGSGVVGPSP